MPHTGLEAVLKVHKCECVWFDDTDASGGFTVMTQEPQFIHFSPLSSKQALLFLLKNSMSVYLKIILELQIWTNAPYCLIHLLSNQHLVELNMDTKASLTGMQACYCRTNICS